MKPEPILAKLYELRKDASGDPDDLEYVALNHAFCFISYNMARFQEYLDEAERGTAGGSADAGNDVRKRDVKP